MSCGDKLIEFIVEKLSQFRDTVADNIMKQLSGQLSHPMLAVSKHRSNVAQITQIVRPVALEMDWLTPQKSLLHQTAHFQHFKSELVIMANRHPQATTICQPDQLFGFICRDREWLLKVNVASELKTLPGQ